MSASTPAPDPAPVPAPVPVDVPVVVVTGANGLVGARTCAALVERGAIVRAVVRRAGTAPALAGVEEHVGDFPDPDFAARVVDGATAVVTTVHPMASDLATQHRIGVEGTPVLARAAAAAGVERFVHVSTAAVYDRSPGRGDVDEAGALVGDDAGDYPVTKRDTDAALADVEGLTRVLLRPPAILGAGGTSVWNTLRPAAVRDDEQARHAVADQTFPWVHVADLAALAADVACGRVATSSDPERGPVDGGCTPVNVAAGPATARDYYTAVAGALDVEMTWDDAPAWTGQLLAGRAHRWGWTPQVDLGAALAEIDAGLRGQGFSRLELEARLNGTAHVIGVSDDLEGRRPDLLGVRRTGAVRWFKEEKGYGRITTDDGEVLFVHFSDIVATGGYRSLKSGQRVSFVWHGGIQDHGRHRAEGVQVVFTED